MPRIVVVGDILLDRYSFGTVRRLNPESPAPLLAIEREEYRLGGAANVAANVASLSGKVALVGWRPREWSDETFERLCRKTDIGLALVESSQERIIKHRFVETTYHQQLLRADTERVVAPTPAEENALLARIAELAPDFLVVSDYAKGTFSDRVIGLVREYARAHGAVTLVDSKPGRLRKFAGYSVIKPNYREFASLADEPVGNTDDEVARTGMRIARELACDLVVTRGTMGATVISTDGRVEHLATRSKDVFDVTGAGDTFLAGIVTGLARWFDLVRAAELGNAASGVVIGTIGTSVIDRASLPEFFSE